MGLLTVRAAILAGVLASTALYGTAAHAQTVSNEDLADLVRAQAAEIAALKERLATLEQATASGQAQNTAPPAQAAAIPATPPAEPSPGRNGGVQWGKGAPVLTSPDGHFTFKPRGRILLDATSTSGSRFSDRNVTTTGSRALRLGVEGTIGKNFFYQFETDFAENTVDVVTAYMGWESKIAGLDFDIRAGNLFNDRGFDGSTGSNAVPFLERNVVGNAILPQRGVYGVGAQLRLFGPSWHASVALTGEDIDSDYSASDSRTLMARAHWNPVKSDKATMHLGLWGFHEHLSERIEDVGRNTFIGGRFNSNLRVSSGPIAGAESSIGYGAELGGFFGPVWTMAEYGRRDIRRLAESDIQVKAWSASAGWYVTGERPPYSSRNGNFTFPKVRRPITEGGFGAIELTARYEDLDYSDAPLGGEGWAATVGVNWYLTDLVRFMLNGIRWHTNNGTGDFVGPDEGNTVSLRAQVSF